MSDVVATEVQSLEITNPLIDLYEIEIGEGSNNILYFHSEKDLENGDTNKDIIFDGNTYITLPIMLEGIEQKSEGAIARPKLTIANVESILKSSGNKFKTQMTDGTWDASIDGDVLLADDFKLDDLIGARLTRRRTLDKYCGSGVTAQEFNKETYIIDRIASKNFMFVEIELAAPIDLSGVRIPNRTVIGKYCPWVYQGWSASNPDAGACYWKLSKQIKDTSGEIYSFYFTGDDEPLVLASQLTGSTGTAWKGAYSSSTTYGKSEYVSNGGLFWRSEADSNTGNTPSESSAFWQIVRTFSGWSSSTTYTIDTGSPPDFRKNPYVGHGSADTYTIWRCVRNQSSSDFKTPGTDTRYWVRGDVCGKLLTSCKRRYQAVPFLTGNTNDLSATVPRCDADLNSYISLPFGGFPGSRKFR
mgnify:FL=1